MSRLSQCDQTQPSGLRLTPFIIRYMLVSNREVNYRDVDFSYLGQTPSVVMGYLLSWCPLLARLR